MGHPVICSVCGKRFDRDIEQAVKSGARRYAHFACMPTGELVPLVEKVDPELAKLKDYIKTLYGDNANWALINKQIKKFKEEDQYSYSGMLKSLIYFYEVKGNPKEKGNNGIGIIPYIYKDAYNYYYNLFVAQEMLKETNIITQIKEIFIKPPKKKGTKKRYFSLGVEEDEE